MLKLIKTIAGVISVGTLLVAASGCSRDQANDNSNPETFGTRNYKLDPEAASIQLSIYGVVMGTPDANKFQFLMRSLKLAGEFNQVTEKNPGIEGGLTICGTFSSTANREAIYELVRSIETDTKNTNFLAVSTDGCSTP